MDLLPRLRGDLQHILRAAVDAIEPAHLVRSALSRGALGAFPTESLFLIAAGKAAWPMAVAFDRAAAAAGTRLEGMVAGPRAGTAELPAGLEWFNASHPSPDAASESAGRRALEVAAESRQRGSLVVLLSGGASAMLAVPAARLSLGDKIAAARVLMNAGAPIGDLNCVRKHLSAIKGGRLGATARRSLTLAISDVHGRADEVPAVIGSGPTVADPSTFADALSIVRRSGVAEAMPVAVMAHLERAEDETPKPGDPRLDESSYQIIGDRHIAMAGAARAARARGYAVRVIEPATSGEARDTGGAFATSALDEPRAAGSLRCVIASGETTVHVRGRGRGGRNQEFALAAVPIIAARAASHPAVVLASAGTDGIDGPTDAAGAIADTTSGTRAERAGLRWEAALASNGAYDFFAPLGDLIVWGPTGTNVGDIHVVLIDDRARPD